MLQLTIDLAQPRALLIRIFELLQLRQLALFAYERQSEITCDSVKQAVLSKDTKLGLGQVKLQYMAFPSELKGIAKLFP